MSTNHAERNRALRLRLLRLRQPPSQIVLAKVASIDRSRLNLFLNGHCELSDEKLKRLERALVTLAQRHAKESMAALVEAVTA